MQAGVGQRGKFREVLLEIRQAEDVAQADAQEFGLMIAAQPQMLVLVVQAVAQVVQNFPGGLALAQPPAQ